MSSLLYSLGRRAFRAKFLVLGIWLAVLAAVGGGALLFNQGANAPITIPGTESQEALDTLSRTFPEVSGSSAQVVVVSADGSEIDVQRYRDAVAKAGDRLEAVPGVAAVMNPFDEISRAVSPDGQAALLTVQLEHNGGGEPSDETLDGIVAEVDRLEAALPEGATATEGGSVFSLEIPSVSPTEAVGVIVAFFVLIFTLGTLIAAGMPLLIALLGVGTSIAGIFLYTALGPITSITPMLALMLGLAVGIDYTLFIVARHQEQLRDGMDPEESAARATATSGSAVIFAGLTVIIALTGLAVAGIPFLTALGLAAAFAVFVAVLMALTLTPAVLGMAGLRILPKKQRLARAAGAARDPHAPAKRARTASDRFFGGWVTAATTWPVVTIVIVLLGLGAAAIPAKDLRLALPDASSLSTEAPARIAYEQIGEHFGPGHNGPLLLTGSIITSTDPLGLMEDLAEEIRAVPGVAEVPLATPNPSADTGIIHVIPETGPHDPETTALVDRLRGMQDTWDEQYGVTLSVTGFTAAGIDISALLGEALLPFGILVVGLSLVLLAMVFRSVWVPIKATLGYLLSVLVAFGAVALVFEHGWLADELNVATLGPVLSFMPIILMGVLFGLAMDYEVFLVARIREEYVHGGDAQRAIRTGFVGTGKVVTSAAIIMIAVFAAFIPAGDVSIKPIALGLAVGVFVDAFIVRMTLVPAVLALLGERAWRMPAWLDRLLPSFDVEGEGLARELAHRDWPADRPDAVIATESLRFGALDAPQTLADLRVGPGEALVLDPADPGSLRLAETLTGRAPVRSGTAKVAGLLLPERASHLRRRSAVVDLAAPDGPRALRERLVERPALLVLSGLDARASTAARASARSALEGRAISRDEAPLTLIVLGSAADAATVLPLGTQPVLPGAAPAPALAKEVTP